MIADEHGHAFGERQVVDVGQPLHRPRRLRGAGEDDSARSALAERVGGQRGGRRRADEDLARLRGGLHRDGRRRGGALTTSSRCSEPVSAKRNSPEWMPTCIFSVTTPAEVRGRPIARSVLRMSNATRAPPVLVAARRRRRAAARRRRTSADRRRSRMRPRAACRSRVHHLGHLLGARPASGASFSDIAVKPEMSTKAIVPSSDRHSRSGQSTQPLDHEPRNIRREVHSDVTFVAGKAVMCRLCLY